MVDRARLGVDGAGPMDPCHSHYEEGIDGLLGPLQRLGGGSRPLATSLAFSPSTPTISRPRTSSGCFACARCYANRAPRSTWDMGMGIVSTVAIDNLMYSIFGFNRTRASILDLMRPRTPIITKSQARLHDLLQAWEPAEDNMWFPWALLGTDFGDAGIRVKARAHALQMTVGIFDVFEMRMQLPAYSLVVLCTGEPDEVVHATIAQFQSIPHECLSLFCSRLKQLFGSPLALKELAPRVIKAWATSTCLSASTSQREVMAR
mmetsp:Transcript_117353/g.373924  ORF Transcript_117353/g.373924 Transcript_117353/m.373924 type:complete len:262 (+) Transcript_117353:1567-2352(+)|eukprot:CAMPEP_0203910392 /NCGR_PEP_ID=MMETSP0359-20131031/51626_1 /ASSEMBLY_ACC=CAM_ASM_000338 /TAXON_ID=268821 /ORGANISM="Scrippsiella Hangoei, Strain SHTV-5" /LENGTH=261 /DNA_ID=CAMNT_0050835857 /DNA_START=85 /DNA_END=870 /DNA_ORIENTATION=-